MFAGNQITTSAGNLSPAKALALVTSQSSCEKVCCRKLGADEGAGPAPFPPPRLSRILGPCTPSAPFPGADVLLATR